MIQAGDFMFSHCKVNVKTLASCGEAVIGGEESALHEANRS